MSASGQDPFAPEQRSAIMRAVKSTGTRPEIALRRLVRMLGAGYRLRNPILPGKPDLIFPARRAVIFLHGCFWHGHDCPRGARAPKANGEYWRAKIARNRARDAATIAALQAAGWRALIVWECALKRQAELRGEVAAFLALPGSR